MKAGRFRPVLLGMPTHLPTLSLLQGCPTLPAMQGVPQSHRGKQGESLVHLLRLEHQSKSFLLQSEVPRTAGRDFTLWALGQSAFKEQ